MRGYRRRQRESEVRQRRPRERTLKHVHYQAWGDYEEQEVHTPLHELLGKEVRLAADIAYKYQREQHPDLLRGQQKSFKHDSW